jgi:hypothetical protein
MKPTQTDRLYNLLSDGKPHRTDEIQVVVYGGDHRGLARVGARIYDIKYKHRVTINGWHDPDNKTLYWYQIVFPDIVNRLSEYLANWYAQNSEQWLQEDDLVLTAARVGYVRSEVLNGLKYLVDLRVITKKETAYKYTF